MTLTIALLYPDLLGTYGDSGNALVLERRARWRGIDVQLQRVSTADPIPKADLYLLGGGEDGPQVRAAALLRADGGLQRGLAEGAQVFAVCAGFQLLGHHFVDASGAATPGLSVLDVETVRSAEQRAVGEVLATCTATALSALPTLTGFENHGGRTRLGAGVEALATVNHGVGNGFDGAEGAVTDQVVATYLHGPVLARNPALADALLERCLGRALEPLDDTTVDLLRADRLRLAP